VDICTKCYKPTNKQCRKEVGLQDFVQSINGTLLQINLRVKQETKNRDGKWSQQLHSFGGRGGGYFFENNETRLG
jgi:heterodisulfide reductase subunit C